MCGIAGALDLVGTRDFPLGRLRAMTDALTHRGPDAEGFHREPGLALGARRLAIVDLDGGSQPLANETGTVWVAFNGELYEDAALRRELLARGHRLATRCDTEAWVHLYEDFGEATLAKVRGQFAVSLWDRATRTLVLGRDRVGICPLFYAERDGWLLWASEVKALLASRLVVAEVDPKGIDQFFSFYCAGTPRTCFTGVSALPPGHLLRVVSGVPQLVRYWDLDFPDAGAERRLADPAPLAEELDGLMQQAVARRLRADVPVASYLSGGVDSTYVLSLTGRVAGGPVPSFTVGFDGAGADESLRAKASAAQLGSRLTTVVMDHASLVSAYPDLTAAAEVPVLDTAAAALLRLAAAVHAQGYKVVLTGEGADEALAGYFWFKIQRTRETLGRHFGPDFPRFLQRLALGMVGGSARHRPPYRALSGVRPAQQDIYEMIAQAREGLYAPALWEKLGGYDPYADLTPPNARIARWHPLNQSLYFGYKVMLAGLLLSAKGDRVAMHSSVEARYPFLDEDVVAFCAQLAPEYKLRGSTEKWLLRRAAARSLPLPVAFRPKQMFRASLARTFLASHRPAWVDQLLSPESLRATGLFSPERVARQRWLQAHVPRLTMARIVYDVGLTSVVATQLWHHTFCGGGLCELPAWEMPPLQAG